MQFDATYCDIKFCSEAEKLQQRRRRRFQTASCTHFIVELILYSSTLYISSNIR